MPDFDINTFDIKKNYVVEASAGTGKTYSIIRMVEKIIDGNPDLFKKILIVTYTEKAAGELKERIRKDIPYVDLATASIYTIHSFCKNIIQEFGITANLPLELDLVNELDLERFAELQFRIGEIGKTISLLKQCGYKINEETYKACFIEGISKYYLDNTFQEDPSIIQYQDSSTSNESCELLNQMILLSNATSLEDVCSIPGMSDFGYYYKVLRDSNSPMAFELVEIINNNIKNCFPTKLKGKAQLKNKDEKDAVDYFNNLYKRFGGSKDDRPKFVKNLMVGVFFRKFFIEWQKEKEFNKVQSFDDMIRSVREAIKTNDEFVKKLRGKYTYGIIDEFQDTNQRQFDIFKSIFMCKDHHIIVVGDPKQSIYAFQGADVQVYNSAKNVIEQNNGISSSLTKNWRSSDSLIDFANNFFGESNNFDFGIATFTDSTSCGKFSFTLNGKNESSIWVGASCIGEDIDKKEYARLVAEQILECCSIDENSKTKLQVDGRNVSFSDFAILARTRSEMAYIKSQLKNIGIPSLQYKDDSLFKGSRECAHWIALLEAINTTDFTLSNRKLFKKALFTDFFGLSLHELSKEKYDRDDNEEIAIFNEWKSLANKKLWEDLIDNIVTKSRLYATLKSLSKSQSFAKFKQIGDYCIDYLYNNHSLDDLIRTLVSLSAGDEEDEGNSIVGTETDFDSVKIMTIHASKGLEFPIVISVAGFKKGFNQLGKTFTYHDEDGNKRLTFDKDTAREQIEREAIDEFKRIIYVAYTRAKYVLFIPNYGASFSPDGFDWLRDATYNYLNNHGGEYRVVLPLNKTTKQLKQEVKVILKNQETKKVDDGNKEDQEGKLIEIIKTESSKKTYKHSYSSISHPQNNEDEDEENLEGEADDGLGSFDKKAMAINGEYHPEIKPIDIPKTFPKGAKIGDTLHKVFENIDFQNYENNLEKITNDAFASNLLKLDEEKMNIARNIVINVLNAKVPEIKGNQGTSKYFSLNEIPLVDKKAEKEFNFNLFVSEDDYERLKNYFNGFIDLMFRRGEYYSILDWKSDSLNETDFLSYSTLNDLKGRVDNSYSIQRVLYAYCLIKWLKLYYKEDEEAVFKKHFGGVYYVFLRGCNKNTSNGVYSQTWGSWKELKEAFDDIVKRRIRVGGNK